MEVLSDIQKQILEGHLLGDGYIHNFIGNGDGSFNIERKAEDENYLLWSIKHFEDYVYRTSLIHRDKFLKITQKSYPSCVFYTKRLPIFTEYRNIWYGSGKKKVPEDLELTSLSVAVWFCDDGHARVRYDKFPNIKISTDGFEKYEVELLVSKLNDRYGDVFKIGKAHKIQYDIVSYNRDGIGRFFEDIISVFPPIPRKLNGIDKFYGLKYTHQPYSIDDISFLEKIEKYFPDCNRCHGNNIKSAGFNKIDKDKKRYFCKDCNKEFMEIKDYIRNFKINHNK